MTELELCQLSQRALLAKLKRVQALSKSRLRRLRKAENAVSRLLVRCEEYERALEPTDA